MTYARLTGGAPELAPKYFANLDGSVTLTNDASEILSYGYKPVAFAQLPDFDPASQTVCESWTDDGACITQHYVVSEAADE
jgi:hypothetical protein